METLILLKAGLRHKKGVFLSIAALMLIIAFSITAIVSTNDSLIANLQSANEQADTGDLVAFIGEEYASSELLARIKANEAVERLRENNILVALETAVNGRASSNRTLLQAYTPGDFPYSIFDRELAGFVSSPEPLRKGEIYVPLSYMSLYDSKLGGPVAIQTTAGEKTFTIGGFIQEPFMGAYFIGIKSLFITQEDYAELEGYADSETDAQPQLLSYRLLHIFKADASGLTIPQFKRLLNRETGILDYSYATLTKEDAIRYTRIFTDIGSGILYAFVILLFIIVMIVMGHSISTGIEMDYTNIGVLKSQGFTKGKIRRVLVLQYLIAQVGGAVLGYLLAIPQIKWIGGLFQPITGMLATSQVSFAKCLGITLAILLLMGLFVFANTARVAQISPLRAISGGRESIYFASRLNVGITKKGLDGSIALRQFTSGKRQYAALIAIAAILVYFMMSMTILANSMTPQAVEEGFGSIRSDITLQLNNRFTMDRAEAIEAEIKRLTPVASSIYLASFYFSVDGGEYNTTLYNNPGEMKSITKGRAPLYDNEIVVTEVLARELDKFMGDTVVLGFRGGKEEYVISGYYESMVDVGRCLAMSLSAGERLYPVTAQYGHIDLADAERKADVMAALNREFGDILTAAESEESNMEDIVASSLNGVTVFIYAVSVVFALVVVFMVCGRTFVKERQNIGIYKAMGFTSRRLRLQFALRFLFISILGAGLGIAASLFLSNRMLNVLLKSMGVTNFNTEYTLFNLLFPSVLTGLCFFLFSYLASAKIKSVSARELIVE